MTDRPVAIITGASRGIGKGIAVELAQLGYDLVLNHFNLDQNGKSDETKALETQQEIRALRVDCEISCADVSDATHRQKLIDLTKSKFGRCDLLCNNAGVAPSKRLDILDATEESYDRVMSINLKGPYFLTQLAANWMIAQQRAFPDRQFRIVNIGSISAYTSSPARGEYCLSKAGVGMMTMLYAHRLAEYGIGVFEVRPGIIMTDMTSAVKDKYDKLIADGVIPNKRWGRPEDIAEAVGAIAEGRLDFSTGQVLDVDGGFHLRRL